MQLIGMLDSPFVRRVAISLTLLELPYEHCSWSVGADFARIREVSALGRVPVLVLAVAALGPRASHGAQGDRPCTRRRRQGAGAGV